MRSLDDAALFAYAAGENTGAHGVLMATHVALRPDARKMVAAIETIGSDALERGTPAEMSPASRVSVLAALDEPANDPVPEPAGDLRWPTPIRSLVAKAEAAGGWRNVGGGARMIDLPVHDEGRRTWMIAVGAGRKMPRHTHEGEEATLVLEGGFTDDSGHYVAGDVAISGPEIDHQPIADPGGECVCLIVTEGGLKLTGPVGRIVNRFVKF